MLSNKEATGFIQAWALGCLDEDDYSAMNEFLNSSEEVDWEQIGDFQNLVALLPLMLTPETPGLQAKDKLARKLYRIKEELLAKKAEAERIKKAEAEKEMELKKKEEESSAPIHNDDMDVTIVEVNTPEEDVEEQVSRKEPVEEVETKSKISEFEVVSSKRFDTKVEKEPLVQQTEQPVIEPTVEKTETHPVNFLEIEKKQQAKTSLDTEKHMADIPDTKTKAKEKPYRESRIYSPPPREKLSKLPIILSIVFFAITIILILFVYISINNSLKEVRTSTSAVGDRMDRLTARLEADLDVDKILTANKVGIVNLSGTNLYPSGKGKLLIDYETSESILLLNDLPPAANGRDYQLWVNVGGEYYSIKVFNVSTAVRHFSLSMPPIPGQYETQFIVTEEITGGGEQPGRRVFLEGTLR